MKRMQYISPGAEELDISTVSFICTSPQSGGSEDVGFEDWLLDSGSSDF